jgi:hypothetical protein
MSIQQIITVSGPTHSKKKHIMTVIKRALEANGVEVSVFGGEEHLQNSINKTDTDLKESLSGCSLLLIDQNT